MARIGTRTSKITSFLAQSIITLRSTIVQFPLPVTAALTATVSGIWLIAADPSHEGKLLCLLLVSIPLFMSSTAFRCAYETHFPEKPRIYAAGNLLLILIAAGYWGWLNLRQNDTSEIEALRFAGITLASFFAFFWVPFIRKDPSYAGHYAVTICIRLFITAVFSAVLYAGIAAALMTIYALLDVHFSMKTFGSVWVLVVGIFAPLFFLSGLPRRADDAAQLTYPPALKILVKFILLPLITVYLAILYIYFAKALATWSLPRGIVTYLIIAYSTAGIIILFLISPIAKLKGNRWIELYTRWFYRALIPLILLLCAAIALRVQQYGITEKRYFIMVLTLWLAGITVYWLFRSKKNHAVIPASLAVLAILSVLGPWDAFRVSRHSQLSRLASILERNGALSGGVLTVRKISFSEKDRAQIYDAVSYLAATHGIDSMGFFPANLRQEGASVMMQKSLGITAPGTEYKKDPLVHSVVVEDPFINPVDIRGYDVLCRSETFRGDKDVRTGKGLTVRYNEERKEISFTASDNRTVTLTVKDLLTSLPKLYPAIQKENGTLFLHSTDITSCTRDLGKVRVKIIFTQICASWTPSGKADRVISADFYLMISER